MGRCLSINNMMTQSKDALDKFYSQEDPWGYKDNIDDAFRKKMILKMLAPYRYDIALDIGCGEGWITKDLPAQKIYGYDISDTATNRVPQKVTPVKDWHGKPFKDEKMDLVITTGTLYSQYAAGSITEKITEKASKHVLVAGIKSWLLPYTFGKVIDEMEFPYREYTQKLTLYEVTPQPKKNK